jgi:hypothetical protein
MRLITRSVFGSALQTSRHLGLDHAVVENSSLNEAIEKLQLNSTIITDLGLLPTVPVYNEQTDTAANHLQYFAIGNGGHRNYTGSGGQPFTAPIPHKATDVTLFKWIPFKLIAPGQPDITGPELAKYRLRRIVTIGGQKYIGYWLKKLDLQGAATAMQRVTVTNGVPTTLPYAPAAGDIPSTPDPNLTQPGVFPNDGSYLTTTAGLEIVFDAAEIQDLRDAVNIMLGNELFAIISEVALCSGVDKETTVRKDIAGGNLASQMMEAVGVQVNTHISAYYPVVYTNDGFDFRMDLGATEPLFGAAAP